MKNGDVFSTGGLDRILAANVIGRKIGREPGLARPRPSVEAVDATYIDALTCK